MTSVCLYCNAWNENDNIIPWIQSGLDAGCTHIAVFDTGGIDETLAKARQYCSERNIPCVTQYEDMNENPSGPDRRRKALELARTLQTDYLLWLDCDDRLSGRLPEDLTQPAYNVTVSLGTFTWHRPHLLRQDTQLDWGDMPRHEAALVNPPATETIPGLTVVEGTHRADNRGGWVSDGVALDKYLETHPDDRRATFYAAQSYRDAGEVFKAIDRYKARIKLGGGYEDEIFYSWYMLGLLSTGVLDSLGYLQLAVNMQPWRLEPYWALVDLCRSKGWIGLAKIWVEAATRAMGDERSKTGLFVDAKAGAAIAAAWSELYEGK